MSSARKPPVFVIGCPRSGTTLLYHILLSSGGFAVYRTESYAFNLIGPKFGDLRTYGARRAFLDAWLPSYKFARTGLDRDQIAERILHECRSTGDFLALVMGEIARSQGVDRWADCTPTHALHLKEIKAAFPDALIIHIIRDGRDAALSLSKLGWIHPFPWDAERGWVASGLFWKWIVEAGRRQGRRMGESDYLEVMFEDLVADPGATTERIGRFIGHEIDYQRVRAAGIGSVSEPNTSFAGGAAAPTFNPVGRWRDAVAPDALVDFEAATGDLLTELGYELTTAAAPRRQPRIGAMRALYPPYFNLKQWVKTNTPLSRYLMRTDVLEQSLPSTVAD